MKVLKLAALTVALSASTLAMADETVVDQGRVFDANQLIPTGARLEVGTTGYGGALLWTANPYVGLALGYNGGDISWSDDLSIDGTKYDADMDNNLTYLNAEIRPWGTSPNRWVQGLYVAAGVGYVDTEYDLKKRSKDGTIKMNGNNYNFNGEVSGKLDYDNQIAPYIGFGIAPKINKNWGLFGEVGAYYTGNPSVNLTSKGEFVNVNGANFDHDLAAEEHDISNKDKYKWLPVGKVGVSYHW
ncbi:ornithine uptake porin CarO [uncultured Acinetobacter sp.]|uniref:ornithine uptake porin CarO n=1 Tax=uncultured Acinetobacter sp. TaxID=165433 RepID=UPI0025E8A0EE|nr:ornithine uptake porin CarO [uncultured Acinetobacter sp.]